MAVAAAVAAAPAALALPPTVSLTLDPQSLTVGGVAQLTVGATTDCRETTLLVTPAVTPAGPSFDPTSAKIASGGSALFAVSTSGAAPGTYTVRAEARDSCGDVATGETTLVVEGEAEPEPEPALIVGAKFEDRNGNGAWEGNPDTPQIEGSEPPVAGWGIMLSGPESAQTTTDAEGRFSFEVTTPGVYTVTEESRAGWQATTATSVQVVISEPPSSVPTILFGNRDLSVVAAPDIEVRDETRFSALRVGQSDRLPVSVHNEGDADLEVSFLALERGVHFRLAGEVEPNPIPPGGSGQFAVAYAPQRFRASGWTDSVRISSNDPNEPLVRHRLVGGTASPGQIDLSCESFPWLEGIPPRLFLVVRVRAVVEGEPFPGALPVSVTVDSPSGERRTEAASIPLGTGTVVAGVFSDTPREGTYRVTASTENQTDYFGDSASCDFGYRELPEPRETRATRVTCTPQSEVVSAFGSERLDVSLRDDRGERLAGVVRVTLFVLDSGGGETQYDESGFVELDAAGRGVYVTPAMAAEGLIRAQVEYLGSQTSEGVRRLPSEGECFFVVAKDFGQRLASGLYKAHLGVLFGPLVPEGLVAFLIADQATSALAEVLIGGDAGDLFWQGEAATPPEASELTLEETVSASASFGSGTMPGPVVAGTEMTVDWVFTRRTDAREMRHEARSRERVHGFRIDALAAASGDAPGSDVSIAAEAVFTETGQIARGRQALLSATLVAADGQPFAGPILLRDDGLGDDALPNDGRYAATYTIAADDPLARRPWRALVTASATGPQGPPSAFSSVSTEVVSEPAPPSVAATPSVTASEPGTLPTAHPLTLDGAPDLLSLSSGAEPHFDLAPSSASLMLVVYLRAQRALDTLTATLSPGAGETGVVVLEDTVTLGPVPLGASAAAVFPIETQAASPGMVTLELEVLGAGAGVLSGARPQRFVVPIAIVEASLEAPAEDRLQGSLGAPGGVLDFTLQTDAGVPVAFEGRLSPSEPFSGLHRDRFGTGSAGGASCLPGPSTLCLNGGRYRVEVEWTDGSGRRGSGRVVPGGSAESGLFWFFEPDNWEMLVKVLDGCAINGHTWVLAASTTDVGLELVVTDTHTGAELRLETAAGEPAPAILETEAFACDATTGSASQTPAAALPGWFSGSVALRSDETVPRPRRRDDASQGRLPACGEEQALCLHDERFVVEVEWSDARERTGVGRVASLGSSSSGLFWFFDPENWEMLVKVLDGCALNDRFWVFAASTTDVGYLLRVTDRETGAVAEYRNPTGRAADAITDTGALAGCR